MKRLNVAHVKAGMEAMRELDAFTKVPEGFQETTASGGGISIFIFVVVVILVVSEVRYYTSTELVFDYEVDKEVSGHLKINLDITVAMKCDQIGADVLDQTGQTAQSFGHLDETLVPFELSPKQRTYYKMIRNVNVFIRNEYHSMHQLLWRSGYTGMHGNLPPREDTPSHQDLNGCRFNGTLTVNKVAGNFHVTIGKSIPVFPQGHAHLPFYVSEKDYNFSHRIDHLSFGDRAPGIITPLDGEEKTTNQNHQMYQYFVQVVPTRVQMMFSHEINTYQIAFTEKDRTIDHNQGSHGVAGIFFKYDLSPLRVTVREEHKSYWRFIVRLCALIGGMYATSGLVHSLVGWLIDLVCCRYRLGSYKSELDKAGSPGAARTASLSSFDSNPSPSPSPALNGFMADNFPTPLLMQQDSVR